MSALETATPNRSRTLDLVGLATELQRRQETKKDYVVDTRRASFQTSQGESALSFDLPGDGGSDSGVVNPHAHGQIADRLSIPKKYYDRLRSEAPTLLDANVNHWLYNKPEKRLIRLLDGKVRAVLSDRFRRLDDYDLLQHVLPIFGTIPGLTFQAASLTDTKLYVRALLPTLQAEIKPGLGDIVQAGISIRNSEVGSGALVVEPFIWRLACLNGMTIPDRKLRKYHVGGRLEESEEIYNVFSDETLAADDKAFFLKVGDLVRSALDETQFNVIVDQLREATTGEQIENPVAATERLAASFTLSQGEQADVLKFLTTGGDLSRFGAVQAVTAAAKNADSFDRQAELEELGGSLVTVTPSAWREFAAA